MVQTQVEIKKREKEGKFLAESDVGKAQQWEIRMDIRAVAEGGRTRILGGRGAGCSKTGLLLYLSTALRKISLLDECSKPGIHCEEEQ